MPPHEAYGQPASLSSDDGLDECAIFQTSASGSEGHMKCKKGFVNYKALYMLEMEMALKKWTILVGASASGYKMP